MEKVTTGNIKGKKAKCIQLKDGTKIFSADDDIENELYTAYGEMLMTGKTSNNNYLSTLVQKSLNRIEIESGKDAYTALQAVREVGKIATSTAQYFQKKKAVDTDFCKYLLREGLFPWQQKVYDETKHKISMLCGRRSGKSYVVCRLAIKHCLVKEEKVREAAIMGLTLEKTAAIYWDNLKTMVEKCHIPVQHIDNGSYTITFSNGNVIRLCGNNSKAEREKFRGFDTSFIAIDEMQSQQGLYYFINDIVGPIIKGRNGDMIFLGTAPLSAGTIWENIINDDKIAHFHATMEDNPTIPNFEHALEDVLDENHWTKDNITFRREYLGEIAYDTERLIYPKRTYYTELPKANWTKCYIGCDYGWRDYSSFAPIIIDDQNNTYLIKEWKQNKTAASELVKQCKILVEDIHKNFDIPMENIKIVQDTSHQQIGADFYNQGVLNIENAYKQDEAYQIARVDEALQIGDLKIVKDSYFDQECDMMVWQWNAEKGCVIYKIDDATFHPDIADSVKYAYNQYLAERNAEW